jgi:hypothetical protein
MFDERGHGTCQNVRKSVGTVRQRCKTAYGFKTELQLQHWWRTNCTTTKQEYSFKCTKPFPQVHQFDYVTDVGASWFTYVNLNLTCNWQIHNEGKLFMTMYVYHLTACMLRHSHSIVVSFHVLTQVVAWMIETVPSEEYACNLIRWLNKGKWQRKWRKEIKVGERKEKKDSQGMSTTLSISEI